MRGLRLLFGSFFISYLLITVGCAPSPRYSTLDGGERASRSEQYNSSSKKKSSTKSSSKSSSEKSSSEKSSSTKSGHHDLKGKASWYGPGYHGRKTASGEKFNMHDMTAAHKTLPFGTMVEVTNLDNGKKIKVRINDRGPFVAGRVIDLSKKAAQKIGMLDAGVCRVKLKVL